MNEPTKEQKFVRNMMWMVESGDEAQAMTKHELIEAICNLDHYHCSSLESAVFGEVVFRLSHPVTWRLRAKLDKIKAKYDAWKYLRNSK